MSLSTKLPIFRALIWLFGVAVALSVGIISYLRPEDKAVADPLIIGTVLITLGLVCEMRLKLYEVEHAALHSSSQAEKTNKILMYSRTDTSFSQKYDELTRALNDLSNGNYDIKSLSELRDDDICSIELLCKDEELRSTCPISAESKEEVIEHISDQHYKASITSHIDAARRGVHVTRIYYFKRRELFDNTEVKEHLAELAKAKIDVRVVLLDQVSPGHETDFLVFGKRKVSVGSFDSHGKISAARVCLAPDEIAKYTNLYNEILRRAPSFAKLH
jgi:hypothetical protein